MRGSAMRRGSYPAINSGGKMKKICVLFSVLVSACASVSTDVRLTHDGVPQAELLVFRESLFLASAVGLYFGESGKYFFVLDNDEYARVKIDAGAHIFQAKAHASPAFELKVNVEAGKTTCIKGHANSAAAGALLIPFIGNAVSSFVLEQVECPNDKVLERYKLAVNS